MSLGLRPQPFLSRLLRLVRGAVAGILCALVAWGLVQTPMIRGLEDWLLDGCFAQRGRRASSAPVLLVNLDDASLDRLRKPAVFLSPELAAVVNHLHDQGAAAIGIDLLIPESYTTLPVLQAGGEGDATTMGAAIKRAASVVLPESWVEDRTLRPLLQWQWGALTEPDALGTDFGLVNLTEDGDQFVRRQQLAVRTREGAITYQFALALLARARRTPVSWDPALQQLALGGEAIPLDKDQMMRINFVGPPGTFPVIPLSRMLEAVRQRQTTPGVRGAIVIIGSTGPGGQDLHNTPYSNRYADYLHRTGGGLMAGPEVHANVLATLHDRAFIITPRWLSSLPWLLALGAALGHAFFRLGLGSGFLLAVLHHFGWKAFALVAFLHGNYRVEMTGMLLLGAMAYSLAFAWRWRVLRRVLRAVKSAPIAQALESDPGQLRLGGETRVVTVLFADIRGFTTFSEHRTPAQVVALLNAYYSVVVPVIEAEGGVIDKFLGDGLMVLFGAIPARTDHADVAVRAALAIVRAIEENRYIWARHEFGGLRIGIGIHTGPVLLGAVGAPTRLDYTAIGDTVNAATRVEGENRRLGSSILITDATFTALSAEQRDRSRIREQAVITSVKGKQTELCLHVVTGPVSSGNSGEDSTGARDPGPGKDASH
jgi:class 3 adenylate cyclase/CHASE2 domain-containing sensor protein